MLLAKPIPPGRRKGTARPAAWGSSHNQRNPRHSCHGHSPNRMKTDSGQSMRTCSLAAGMKSSRSRQIELFRPASAATRSASALFLANRWTGRGVAVSFVIFNGELHSLRKMSELIMNCHIQSWSQLLSPAYSAWLVPGLSGFLRRIKEFRAGATSVIAAF